MLISCSLSQRQNKGKSFIERPRVREFIDYLFKCHRVMVWSSARPENVIPMCEKLFTRQQFNALVAIWARDKLRLPAHLFGERVQVYKQLSWIWEDFDIEATHPHYYDGGSWSQANTVLIDDSIGIDSKAASEPYNVIQLEEFEAKPEQMESPVLAQVAWYLEHLKMQADVSAFMRQTPFPRDLKVDLAGYLEQASHARQSGDAQELTSYLQAASNARQKQYAQQDSNFQSPDHPQQQHNTQTQSPPHSAAHQPPTSFQHTSSYYQAADLDHTPSYHHTTSYGQSTTYHQPTRYSQSTSYMQPTSYHQPTSDSHTSTYHHSTSFALPMRGTRTSTSTRPAHYTQPASAIQATDDIKPASNVSRAKVQPETYTAPASDAQFTGEGENEREAHEIGAGSEPSATSASVQEGVDQIPGLHFYNSLAMRPKK